jgi:TonB family protein
MFWETTVRFRWVRQAIGIVLLGCLSGGVGVIALSSAAWAQSELTRKVKTKVDPPYPALARRLNIRGTVKVLVVVGPNGELKETKVVGGNPILVDAALDALKQWKFEPATESSTGTVEFKFQPE